jgi:hypothetical protein
MSNHSPSVGPLVGRAIAASIGEPWDFSSAAGDNLLTGRIAAVSAPDDAVGWLICDVSPFVADGQTISTVAAVRRYAGEEPMAALVTAQTAYAQLLYDRSGVALTAERVRAILAAPAVASGGISFLIGSIRLMPDA